jgi:hypothetical protein
MHFNDSKIVLLIIVGRSLWLLFAREDNAEHWPGSTLGIMGCGNVHFESLPWILIPLLSFTLRVRKILFAVLVYIHYCILMEL